jgi:metal-dependent amidase/aminoacylase/carboxypeptidase family protein
MLPTLQKTAGKDHVLLSKTVTGAEDFSFYQEKIPGLFVFVGGKPKDKDPQETAAHHIPDFFINESGMKLGVKTYCMLALDYLEMKK